MPMVPWKKTLTIPSLRKNDHRTGLVWFLPVSVFQNPGSLLSPKDIALSPASDTWSHIKVSEESSPFSKIHSGALALWGSVDVVVGGLSSEGWCVKLYGRDKGLAGWP